jgi:hypothetical protein
MPDPILGEQHFIPNPLVDTQRTRFYRDPSSGSLSVQYTKDGGQNWKQFISQPSSLATEGWVPTLDVSGDVIWRPINSLITLSNTNGGNNSGGTGATSPGFIDFYFPGALFSGKTFGYFDVPGTESLICYGMQISFFMSPSGGATVVQLREDSSNSVINEVIVDEGKIFHYEIFVQEKEFFPQDEIRLRVVSVANTNPGEFMTCRLLFK